jgi:hypothetical protein
MCFDFCVAAIRVRYVACELVLRDLLTDAFELAPFLRAPFGLRVGNDGSGRHHLEWFCDRRFGTD